jgi:hypothetical protein
MVVQHRQTRLGRLAVKDHTVEKFIQLPVLWRHPWLKYICRLIVSFVPVRTQAKFPGWSRELMLLAVRGK